MEQTSVKDIADLLRMRKKGGRPTVLFLGARTGGLFGNATLYRHVEGFSLKTFDTLSDAEKFRQAYSVLRQNRFNESNIFDILMAASRDENNSIYRDEDVNLVELVKDGYFDVIITTNTDMLLEDAFMYMKIKDRKKRVLDYQVVIVGKDIINKDTIASAVKRCIMIKVFGDLESRRYTTVGNEFKLDADRSLKEFLESHLAKRTLVIGYDSVWDKPLERVFPHVGEEFWYVNEEKPAEDLLITEAIEQRSGKYLPGSYTEFIRDLYAELQNQRQPLRGELLSNEPVSEISIQLQQIHNEQQELRKDIQQIRDVVEVCRDLLQNCRLTKQIRDVVEVCRDLLQNCRLTKGRS